MCNHTWRVFYSCLFEALGGAHIRHGFLRHAKFSFSRRRGCVREKGAERCIKMDLIKRMLFVAIVSVAAFVQAATEIVDGIEWTYTVTGGKASVGGGYSSSTAVPTSMSGAIIIPSILGGYSVTSIGNYAFKNCDSLTSVTIPDSVTSIGVGAFDSCSSLKSVTIPDSVTSIGRWAFGDCSSLTSVTIPDGVTSIGDSAFRDCSSLTRVAMPDSITNIGYRNTR